jgi:transglutaminase-like putative cysteine protease
MYKFNKSVKTRYYLSQLTVDKDIQNYWTIYKGILDRAESIEIDESSTEKISFLFKCVKMDYPELFYTNNYRYSLDDVTEKITMLPIYELTEDEQSEAEKQITEYRDRVFDLFTEDMSDFDKELIIYSYISANTEYQLDSKYNQNLYSVVLGKSVCLGYTRMFMYLCEEAGIKCLIVKGNDKETGVGHAWNAVELDNKWYMVDCTSSKGSLTGSKDDEVYYSFNVTTDMIKGDYVLDSSISYPECASYDMDYYKMNGLYFNSNNSDEYIELLKDKIENSSEGTLTARMSDLSTLEEIMNRLVNNKELNNFLFGKQFEVMEDKQLLIIEIKWKGVS